MTRFRHGLIVAALLSATLSCVLAAEPLDGVRATVNGTVEERSEPAGTGTVQGDAPGFRPGLRDSVLASHALQPAKRLEFGIGLAHDFPVQGDTRWYGVYLKSLDRVAERDTIYGPLRETARFGRDDRGTPPAACCRRNEALTSLEKFASIVNAREASPAFFFFGLLKKKEWDLEIADGWKLLAGYRRIQLSNTAQVKVGFLTVESYWERLRATYSYQLERSDYSRAAPRQVAQIEYLFNPRDSIGVSLTNGRGIASFGQLGMLNTEMRSAAIHGQHWFKRSWALTFQAGYNDHGNMPADAGARLGIQHSF